VRIADRHQLLAHDVIFLHALEVAAHFGVELFGGRQALLQVGELRADLFHLVLGATAARL
jgi:hypothetical protein